MNTGKAAEPSAGPVRLCERTLPEYGWAREDIRVMIYQVKRSGAGRRRRPCSGSGADSMRRDSFLGGGPRDRGAGSA